MMESKTQKPLGMDEEALLEALLVNPGQMRRAAIRGGRRHVSAELSRTEGGFINFPFSDS